VSAPGTTPTALVIMPTYNERENLPIVAQGLMQVPNVSLLIVDDHSPDGTGDVADALAREYAGRIDVMHRSGPRGLGHAYIDGISAAIERPFEVICQMDADLSHDPKDLPSLIAAASQADVVIGSRYVPGGGIRNWPLRRRILSRFANFYIRLVTRLTPHDCTSGFRCWKRSALAAIPLDRVTSDGYSFLVELLFIASTLRLRTAEVPITFVERRLGESKLSSAVIFESAVTPWRLIASRKTARPTVR
jgi:dolichol-phosphate mannosyltransferase